MRTALITDPTHPAAEAIAKRLREDGYTVYEGGDFTTAQGAGETFSRTGAVDALIISGHEEYRGLISQGDANAIARAGNANIMAAFHAARQYGLPMMQQGRGSVIFLTSPHSMKPTCANAAYSVSQGALAMMMKELALYYGHYGIRVNSVSLGAMKEEEEMFFSELAGGEYDAETKIPLSRRATGEDAAGAVAFLLSEAAAFVNGDTLSVDGGHFYYYFDRPYSDKKGATLA